MATHAEEAVDVNDRRKFDVGRHWPESYKAEARLVAEHGSMDAAHYTKNEGARLPPRPSERVITMVGDLIHASS